MKLYIYNVYNDRFHTQKKNFTIAYFSGSVNFAETAAAGGLVHI